MNTISKTLIFCMGAILFSSGWIHIQNPMEFVHSIEQYQLTNELTSIVVACFLPAALLIVGLNLVLELAARASYLMGGLFFLMFATVQATALLRGLRIPTGYFGPEGYQVSLLAVALCGISALFLFAQSAFYRESRRHTESGAETNVSPPN